MFNNAGRNNALEEDEQVIAKTIKWIETVVIGCNFCPFAAREIKRGSVYYTVSRSGDIKIGLEALAMAFERMDNDKTIETAFLIFPDDFSDFFRYLDLADLAEKLLKKLGYEGVYQVASFHPEYLFAGSNELDPANYTNRSIFPMLHLLREGSVSIALETFPHPEMIPENNIAYARKKGINYMKELRESCMK